MRGIRVPRAPLAVLAAFAAAEVAVLLLRPRSGVIAPAPVHAASYFTHAQIVRGANFERPQVALYAGQLAIEVAALVLLVRRPPALLRRAERHPLLGGAATGAGLSIALSLATLPLAAVGRGRAIDVGLVTQSWGGWAGDSAKSIAIGALLAGAGGALAVALMRRFPRGWWAPGAAGIVAIGALFLYAGPVVLDPIFNRFTPLPDGSTRSEILALAREAGVKVGQVYEVDASRRTTAANAYVTGLGTTKRVVVYDTLLRDFTPAETRLVVAHELGHVHYRDVPRGLLFLAIVAPFGAFAIQRLSWRLSPARGTAAALPAVVLALGIVSTPITWISNQLSRRVEARADSFALRLTHAPRAYIDFQRKIAIQNVDDVAPPRWLSDVLDTHPPAVDRIGAAVAYERADR